MDLRYTAQHEAFRTELRRFLDEHWTDEDRQHNPPPKPTWLIAPVHRRDPAAIRLRTTAIARGYLYRHVPHAYGGGERPWDPAKEMIVAEEFDRAQAPGELIGNGPNVLVPTLLEYGTEAQKTRFIRNVLLGNEYWCQGYSEPEAGSDLAALRTHAVLDGNHWLVNGHKIWTSMAHVSDWMFALVRTEPTAPRHRGLTYLLIDMATPGVTVRPLAQINGETEFAEVFLDDVRVPVAHTVGKRGEGWAVSLSSLKHERQSVGTTLINPRMLDGVIGLARAIMVRGRPAIHDPVIRNRLVELQARMYANVYHGYRLTTLGLRQQETGVAGMITKLYGSTLGYELPKLAMDIVADGGLLWADSAPASGIAPNAYMQAFGALAGGGTANIQRNIIAERGLGLPRERLFATGRKLMTALKDLLADAGIPAQILGEPPTFEVWFTDREITDFHSNMQADAALRERFVQLLVDRGIIKAHEKFFISLAHTDEEVETTIAAFRSAIAELREGRV